MLSFSLNEGGMGLAYVQRTEWSLSVVSGM